MKIRNEVLGVLSQCETEGNRLRIVGQLERPMYEAVNKVLEAAGGKWKRGKPGAHVFDGDAAAAIEQVLLTGEVTVPQDFGYFPTPAPIVEQLLELASLGPDMVVLEPSAGQGNIVKALLAAGCQVSCAELLPKNCQALDKLGVGAKTICGDFLEVRPSPCFDRVVMNPPFEKRADIHHVLHALKFLKPDGLLVSVMSAGVVFRSDRLTTEFRDLVEARGGSIEELPDESFKASGTSVRTVVVTIPGEAA